MTLLTRDQSMSRPPLLKTELIPVPEFGDEVELAVRGLTARQRWEWSKEVSKKADDDKPGPEPTSYLITLAAIDEDGKLIYQKQDSDNIAEWPGDLVDRIGTKIMQMSGLAPKATETAKKDSGETSSDDSPSDSDDASDAPPTS